MPVDADRTLTVPAMPAVQIPRDPIAEVVDAVLRWRALVTKQPVERELAAREREAMVAKMVELEGRT